MQFHKKTSVGKYSFVIRLLAKLALLILLVFVVIVLAKRGAFNRGPYGSYDTPVSMKQLWRLRQEGYDGPQPTSSREAHWRIRDLFRGGDGTDIPDRE